MALQLLGRMTRRTLQTSPSFVEALVDATVLARAEGRVEPWNTRRQSSPKLDTRPRVPYGTDFWISWTSATSGSIWHASPQLMVVACLEGTCVSCCAHW